MKKLFYSMFAIAMALTAFTSCEDVPAPYLDPNNQEKTPEPVDENLIMEETFAKGFGTFEVITPKGLPWTISHSTATATGYNNGTNTESESYLISPDINLTDVDKAYLEFEYIFAYPTRKGEDKVFISDNYTGDPTTTQWTDITGTLNPWSNGDWNTWSKFIYAFGQDYLGKSNIRIALYFYGTPTDSRTWEVKNLKIRKGEPEEEPAPELPTDLVGDGTVENPYNVASALQVIQAVGSAGTNDEVYVKGKVVKIEPGKDGFPNDFGNVSFYISDDGTETNQLYIYRCFGLNGDKISDPNYFKAGDDVVLVGKLVNFSNNTPEMTSGGKMYSLNGQTGPAPVPLADPTGSGTVEDPYNVSAALGYIGTLGKDVQSPGEIYVKGIISKIKEVDTGQFGNATYWISDDGTTNNELQVFHSFYLQNKLFTNADAIKVGDEVVVCGKVVNYKGDTPEFVDKASYLYSVNGDTGAPKVAGTHDAPLKVNEAIAFGDADHAWVQGYIVGVIDASGVPHFSYNDEEITNPALPILIYSEPVFNIITKEQCIAVQTVRGSDIRNNLHPAYQTMGRNVIVYGKLGDYNGIRGLSNVTYAEIITANGTQPIGTPPEE